MRSCLSRREWLWVAGLSAPVSMLQGWQTEWAIGVSDLLGGKGFVGIPPGEFQMGSTIGSADEQPVHRVRLTRGFEMGKFEVTQEQWEGVMRDPHDRAGTPAKPSHFQGTGLPVENVTWEDVQAFLKRLNARDENHVYRLPTEAEWEYACGSGGKESRSATPHDAAWYESNAEKQTHPVGGKAANTWGLFDMRGNVAEWVHDWYGRDYYQESPASDPQGPDTGSYRVYRGGCWFDPAKYCRASYRGFDFPSSKYYNVGFRLVRTSKGS
jgi:formylglycine-generating enzyme required for sulfatase activity